MSRCANKALSRGPLSFSSIGRKALPKKVYQSLRTPHLLARNLISLNVTCFGYFTDCQIPEASN